MPFGAPFIDVGLIVMCDIKTKSKFAILLLILPLLLVSCSENSRVEQVYSEPIFDVSLKSKDHLFLENVENETDYSNIIIYSDCQAYPNDATEIALVLTDNNIGKGFYFYPIPFIEKKQNGEWIRIAYRDPSANYESTWHYCAIENNTAQSNSTIVTLLAEYLEGGFSTGEYKVTVYVGDKKVSTTFKIN